MAWIIWDNILASYEHGGLGVGSLKAFNIALLQKWRWRFLNNPKLLWVKLIKAIFRLEAGFDGKGCYTQGIWANIVGSSNYLHSGNLIPNDTLNAKLVVAYLYGPGKTYGLETTPCIRGDPFGFFGLFAMVSTRAYIDQLLLPSLNIATRWNTYLPRNVNIFIRRMRLDRLLHRLKLYTPRKRNLLITRTLKKDYETLSSKIVESMRRRSCQRPTDFEAPNPPPSNIKTPSKIDCETGRKPNMDKNQASNPRMKQISAIQIPTNDNFYEEQPEPVTYKENHVNNPP
ncbi:hypothetical protein Tco_1570074 [Tanacetum coccineum]